MSVPREVIPARFYMITRRCTQRQFLLRPDRETNNNFLYCLAEAAARFEIDVLLPSCAKTRSAQIDAIVDRACPAGSIDRVVNDRSSDNVATGLPILRPDHRSTPRGPATRALACDLHAPPWFDGA